MHGRGVTIAPHMNNLQYPIGILEARSETTPEQKLSFIESIARLPAQLRVAVADLTPAQLNEPYRPGGWTIRQVVHHIPDSHLNAYTRFKLGLTEADPIIRPYDEAKWALLEDGLRG